MVRIIYAGAVRQFLFYLFACFFVIRRTYSDRAPPNTHTHTHSLTQHDLFAPSRCAFRIHLYVLRTVFGRHGDGRAAASAFFPLFLSASLSLPSRCSPSLSLSFRRTPPLLLYALLCSELLNEPMSATFGSSYRRCCRRRCSCSCRCRRAVTAGIRIRIRSFSSPSAENANRNFPLWVFSTSRRSRSLLLHGTENSMHVN